MKLFSLKSILTAGLFLLPSLTLRADPDTTLIVELSGYFQVSQSVSGDVQSGKTGIFRVNSKQLLAMIAKEKGIRFPSGTVLKVREAGSVFVESKDGNLIMEADDFIQLRFLRGKELLNGQVNLVTGREDSRTFYPLILKLNFPLLQGTLRGLGVADTLVSPPNQLGIQTSQVEVNSSIYGTGSVKEGTGHITGKINLQGKSATIR